MNAHEENKDKGFEIIKQESHTYLISLKQNAKIQISHSTITTFDCVAISPKSDFTAERVF